MENDEKSGLTVGDITAAVPLEISAELAEGVENLLRELAEDAGLSTALVVDRSGALVAGISSEEEVTVEVISALVAGASGAVRALVEQWGETGSMESLHFGGNRTIYLKEMVNRFILVGVSDGSRPAGLIRQRAGAIESELSGLLSKVKPAVMAPSDPPPAVRSLREIAEERAVRRKIAVAEAVRTEIPLPANESVENEESPPPPLHEPIPEIIHPREVLEPLDPGELEIVIEPSGAGDSPYPGVKDFAAISPFETDDEESEEEESGGVVMANPDSIFELDEEDELELSEEDGLEFPDKTDPLPHRFVVEGEVEPEDGGFVGEDVFEFDEFENEDEDETDDIGSEIKEMIDEEDQESEVRSSGPFYF